MAAINALTCLTTSGNTGVGSCFFDPKSIIGALLTPKGYEFDVTTPQSTLVSATHNASKAARIYPIYDLEATTDSTEDKVIQTMPGGQKHVVREGFNDWKFQYVEGGLSLLQSLRKNNGTAHDFYFIDANMNILGIVGSTPTKLKAIPVTGGFFWAAPFKLNDGSKITEYMIQFVFNTVYINDRFAFVAAGFDLPSLVLGLQDVNIAAGTASGTPGTYNVQLLTAATKTNLGDLGITTALQTAGNIVATNTETGAAITIISTTYNLTTGNFAVALDTTDTDYPSTGQHVSINLATPSVLQTAGIDGYESTGAVSIAKN